MLLAYDPRNQSIRVPYTAAQFQQRLEAHGGYFGLNILASFPNDNIDFKIKYRHERAHFVSYVSSGLLEFCAIFEDYESLLLAMAFNYLSEGQDEIVLPLVRADKRNIDPAASLVRAAVTQIAEIEALFFGYGSTKSVDALFNWSIQADCLSAIYGDYYKAYPQVYQMKRIFDQIVYTTDPDVSKLSNVYLPFRQLDKGRALTLSSRSVIEAYAVTVEVVAEYVKAIFVDDDKAPTRKGYDRKLAILDQTALLAALDVISKEKIDLQDYLSGKVSGEVYWSISLVAFASMIVPVLEDLGEGSSLILGSMKQLLPASRFAHILANIEKGIIEHPRVTYHDNLPSDITGSKLDLVILDWLNSCCTSIGDPWSMKILKRVVKDLYGTRQLSGIITSKTMSNMGRVVLMANTYDTIIEAAIWHPSLHPNYIHTADGELFSPLIVDDGRVWLGSTLSDNRTKIFMAYGIASGSYILELVVDEQYWETNWDKLAFREEDRKTAAFIAITHWMRFFNRSIPMSSISFAPGFR